LTFRVRVAGSAVIAFLKLAFKDAVDIRPAFSRSVAQSGSAPRSGRGGRRFKSCHSDHYLAEVRPLRGTPWAASSSSMDKLPNGARQSPPPLNALPIALMQAVLMPPRASFSPRDTA